MELSLSHVQHLATAGAASAAEEDLVARSRAGDPDAFAALVRLHQRRVFRLAGRFFRERADVEEVAQDTFLIAWRKLDTYRGVAPLESWITRICLNTCYARLRAGKTTEPLLDIDLASRDPSPDTRIEVERLLAHLSADDRFVLLLLDGEGWSVAEIAERLGWTRVNVKVRAHRARRKLRKLLSEGVRS